MQKNHVIQWTEPPSVRWHLLNISGGPRPLFLRDLRGTGVPIAAMIMLVWLFARATGADAMPFFGALPLSVGFGATVALFLTVLYVFVPYVQIAPNYMVVGTKKLDRKVIQGSEWERHIIDRIELDVLHLMTSRGSFRVAVPNEKVREEVELVVECWGIEHP